MTDEEIQKLRMGLEGELSGLRMARSSYWTHWRELADFLLPRRYKWLITPNESTQGSPINHHILDATGTIAARRLASGMMSGITSPTRPWFKLRIPGLVDNETDPASVWLAEVETRMMRVFAESNFYAAMATMYFDLVVFGSACMLIYEDYEDVIRCFNPCAGEYYLGNSSKMRVNTVFREFTMTVQQTVEEFGEDKVSDGVAATFKLQDRAGLSTNLVICHAVRPLKNKSGKYEEVYWEQGSTNTKILRRKVFQEWPACCPRWDLTSNEAYGRSPGMDALPDVKQLQQETRRKAQALDKMVNPPMVADMQLKNQPASLLPGGVTYVSGLQRGTQAFQPAYQVMPPIAELMNDIAQVQGRIGDIFFNDLFMMISSLETVRTATEIDARREEKLVQLGPVLERFENEALDPCINRVFNIMLRAGLLPPAPEEIQGQELQIQYVSMLAEAQRASGTVAIERLLQIAGNMMAVDQTVMDNIDLDRVVQEYANILNVSPSLLRDSETLLALREQRAEQVAAKEALAMGSQVAQGAETLSKTDVGGGMNALSAMIGG